MIPSGQWTTVHRCCADDHCSLCGGALDHYERVPLSRRARWHRQIGTRLELGYGEQAGELAAKLAEHFVRGRNARRAVQYLAYAGENAWQRNAHQEAIAHLHQGLALLSTLPETTERHAQRLTLQSTLDAVLEDLQRPI